MFLTAGLALGAIAGCFGGGDEPEPTVDIQATIDAAVREATPTETPTPEPHGDAGTDGSPYTGHCRHRCRSPRRRSADARASDCNSRTYGDPGTNQYSGSYQYSGPDPHAYAGA